MVDLIKKTRLVQQYHLEEAIFLNFTVHVHQEDIMSHLRIRASAPPWGKCANFVA